MRQDYLERRVFALSPIAHLSIVVSAMRVVPRSAQHIRVNADRVITARIDVDNVQVMSRLLRSPGSTVASHQTQRAGVTSRGATGGPTARTLLSSLLCLSSSCGSSARASACWCWMGELISVRLIDGISVLRDVKVNSPEAAFCTAEMWESEETKATRGLF